MTAPRVAPDPWTACEDIVCELAASHPPQPLEFVGWLFVASTILAAGAIGAGLGWLLAKWMGWR